MDYIKVVLSSRVSLLVLMTVVLQSLVLLSGMYLKLSLPRVSSGGLPSAKEMQAAFLEEFSDIEAESPVPVIEPNLKEEETPEVEVVTHQVRTGETLSTIWKQHTGNSRGGLLAAQAFKGAKVPLSALKNGEEIQLQLSPEGDITGLRKKLDKGSVLLLDGNSTAGYSATITEPAVDQVSKTASGVIYSSLAVDARLHNVPAEVVDGLIDLLGGTIEFRRDIQPGDTFSVTYMEHQAEDGRIVKNGPITSASIVSQGRLHAAIGYAGKDGKIRYYDKEGKPLGNYFLRYPLKFSRISSVFTDSRLHPILGVKRPHHGVDFAAPVGTPVRAVGPGSVVYAGNGGYAGNMVQIKHNSKYSTAYLHLSKIKSGLKKNSLVQRGEVIGYVGSTGLSTGPHLDFRLTVNNKYVNPLQVGLPQVPDSDERIPAPFLLAALAHLRQQHQLQRMLAAKQLEEKGV